MNTLATIFNLVAFSLPLLGQNLVLNGSFEAYSACPTSAAQIDYSANWTSPSAGNPDFFHACSSSSIVDVPNNYWGYQTPRSGEAYAGLNLIYYTIPNFREYIEGEFSSPLQANITYEFHMYLNKADNSQHATSDIGVYFSPTKIAGITSNSVLNFTPQIINSPGNFISDSAAWLLISSTYKAAGGEKYFVIGNYKNDAATTTSLINTNGNQTNGYVYIDDVSMNITTGLETLHNQNNIHLYPNPFDQQITIETGNNEILMLFVYDATLSLLIQLEVKNAITLETKDLPKGLYFYDLKKGNVQIKKGKILKQ